ncbi:MAG TPA: hypothetical protein EYP35_07865 [Desulfobacterales bacterium]|nr:hypothetical protein [Desulfobacterales bacterium]HIP39857.1 hypothetical protein [Desulfocapsa sulfexigens]
MNEGECMFYLTLFESLHECNVKYLLIGGLAVNLHGIPRMTMDIDLVVALDSENLSNFVQAAEKLQLKPVLPLALSDLLIPEKRLHWAKDRNMIAFALQPPELGDPTLDILIDPPIDIETAFERSVCRDLAGTRITLASIEDMILLKKASGRMQDVADIEHLEKLLPSEGMQ